MIILISLRGQDHEMQLNVSLIYLITELFSFWNPDSLQHNLGKVDIVVLLSLF